MIHTISTSFNYFASILIFSYFSWEISLFLLEKFLDDHVALFKISNYLLFGGSRPKQTLMGLHNLNTEDTHFV